MTKKPKSPTFADILKKPTWSEGEAARSGQHAVRPGHFNRAGEFFDLEGRLLGLTREDVDFYEASRLVAGGALVVFEGCGCGGNAPGCTPEWFTGERLERLRRGKGPEHVTGYRAPTWLDVWANEDVEVVFAHGSVSWGDDLG